MVEGFLMATSTNVPARQSKWALCALLVVTACVQTYGAEVRTPLLESDVLPILTKHCMGCHGGLKKEGGLDLRTVQGMLTGGDAGTAIVSHDAAKSELWLRVESDEMPAGKEREKLSSAEKGIIKNWINAGLPTVAERQKNVDPLLSADKKHTPLEVAAAIDKHVDGFLSAAALKPAAKSDDTEFLRRVYLTLHGRVPTAEQAAEFLDSEDADKRAKLIDELLAQPDFGKQLGRTWRDWVCPPELPSDQNSGRQPIGQVRDLGKWFAKRFNEDATWDQITRDILTGKGEIKDHHQLIFFGVNGIDGRITADGSARAVASLFMGVQLQCARCHDDPYRDWAQREHWALAAFFGRSQGDFGKIEVGKGPSREPGEIQIPNSAFKNAGDAVKVGFLGDAEAHVDTSGDLRVPFVDWLTRKDNPYFARALVNRLWFYLFSRGFVNPIDDMRPLNPPSHPGLLQMLASEFTLSGYDIKHLLRCICLSQTYQRSSRVEAGMDPLERSALTTAFGRMPLRLMTAEMLRDSLKAAYGSAEFDIRTGPKDNTTGESAAVGDAELEFQRKFSTNEEDTTDFTHGISQMLTFINHPRFLEKTSEFEKRLAERQTLTTEEMVNWLYLSTLSRLPTAEESTESQQYLASETEDGPDYIGLLWTLVNRSEFILIR